MMSEETGGQGQPVESTPSDGSRAAAPSSQEPILPPPEGSRVAADEYHEAKPQVDEDAEREKLEGGIHEQEMQPGTLPDDGDGGGEQPSQPKPPGEGGQQQQQQGFDEDAGREKLEGGFHDQEMEPRTLPDDEDAGGKLPSQPKPPGERGQQQQQQQQGAVAFSTELVNDAQHRERPMHEHEAGPTEGESGTVAMAVVTESTNGASAGERDERRSEAEGREGAGDDGDAEEGEIILEHASSSQAGTGAEGTECFVGGLRPNVTEEELRRLFSHCGEVVEVRMVMDRRSGGSKGYAFVSFATKESARRAQIEISGFLLEGRALEVNPVEANRRVTVTNLDPAWGEEEFRAKFMPAIDKLRGIRTVEFFPKQEQREGEGSLGHERKAGMGIIRFDSLTMAKQALKTTEGRVEVSDGRVLRLDLGEADREANDDERRMVFMFKLPQDVAKDDVKAVFKKYGTVVKVWLAAVDGPKGPKVREDWGYVLMESKDAAEAAREGEGGKLVLQGASVELSSERPMFRSPRRSYDHAYRDPGPPSRRPVNAGGSGGGGRGGNAPYHRNGRGDGGNGGMGSLSYHRGSRDSYSRLSHDGPLPSRSAPYEDRKRRDRDMWDDRGPPKRRYLGDAHPRSPPRGGGPPPYVDRSRPPPRDDWGRRGPPPGLGGYGGGRDYGPPVRDPVPPPVHGPPPSYREGPPFGGPYANDRHGPPSYRPRDGRGDVEPPYRSGGGGVAGRGRGEARYNGPGRRGGDRSPRDRSPYSRRDGYDSVRGGPPSDRHAPYPADRYGPRQPLPEPEPLPAYPPALPPPVAHPPPRADYRALPPPRQVPYYPPADDPYSRPPVASPPVAPHSSYGSDPSRYSTPPAPSDPYAASSARTTDPPYPYTATHAHAPPAADPHAASAYTYPPQQQQHQPQQQAPPQQPKLAFYAPPPLDVPAPSPAAPSAAHASPSATVKGPRLMPPGAKPKLMPPGAKAKQAADAKAAAAAAAAATKKPQPQQPPPKPLPTAVPTYAPPTNGQPQAPYAPAPAAPHPQHHHHPQQQQHVSTYQQDYESPAPYYDPRYPSYGSHDPYGPPSTALPPPSVGHSYADHPGYPAQSRTSDVRPPSTGRPSTSQYYQQGPVTRTAPPQRYGAYGAPSGRGRGR